MPNYEEDVMNENIRKLNELLDRQVAYMVAVYELTHNNPRRFVICFTKPY